jgi:hypothetical protein
VHEVAVYKEVNKILEIIQVHTDYCAFIISVPSCKHSMVRFAGLWWMNAIVRACSKGLSSALVVRLKYSASGEC